MDWIIKKYKDLTINELYQILALRARVFVVEQHCIYNDLDDQDQSAVHIFKQGNNKVEAYLRILPEHFRFPEYSIGRVVVDRESRKNGFGREIMHEAINYLVNTTGAEKIRISAQSYLEKFYRNLGFEPDSEEYLEDGIPHIEMIYNKKDRELPRP
ncbi:MAG: GNAT family N-acetyltransferase [Bacteroidales bacterium]|nr:GNAT family N-acetyltransferase [Bacteroidales bacterium]MBN2817871.1 GNAT family N-acetyltransferase [Bacteroidales bacterium]